MPKSVLVIGGSGFLGRHVVKSLIEKDYDVGIAGRRNTNSPPGVPFYRVDITKPEEVYESNGKQSLEELVNKYDIVINCAGIVSYSKRKSEEIHSLNFCGANNVADACRDKGKPLIHTSSAAVLGPSSNSKGKTEGEILQEDDAERFGPYFLSKYTSEKSLFEFSDWTKGLKFIIMRPGSLVGPGETSTTKLIRTLAKGFRPGLKGGASFAYVEDVAKAYASAADKISEEQSLDQEVYNLGGHNLSYKKFFSKAEKVLGRTPIPVLFPFFLLNKATGYCFFVNSKKAVQELGYRISNLDKAIGRSIQENPGLYGIKDFKPYFSSSKPFAAKAQTRQ